MVLVEGEARLGEGRASNLMGPRENIWVAWPAEASDVEATVFVILSTAERLSIGSLRAIRSCVLTECIFRSSLSARAAIAAT